MKNEIVNKVANSGIITLDLSKYAVKESIEGFDIKEFLSDGNILKEKEFRASLKKYDFSKYKNKIVAIYCSVNTIVPMWGFMLVASYLSSICADLYYGKKETVFQEILLKKITNIDWEEFKGKRVIVAGCSSVPLSAALYIAITKKLQKNVISLMFGEACSAVPIYKKKK